MKSARHILFLFFLTCCSIQAAAPTFGDLADLLAKGYFGRYIKPDASTEQCAAFLNSKGICFSLFDLVDTDKAVGNEDFARAIGRSMLLFSGEAEIANGCIKKPAEAETWVDYCLLNDIDLPAIWNGFVRCAAEESLIEVRESFVR